MVYTVFVKTIKLSTAILNLQLKMSSCHFVSGVCASRRLSRSKINSMGALLKWLPSRPTSLQGPRTKSHTSIVYSKRQRVCEAGLMFEP